MTDPIRLKVLHLDSNALQTLSQLLQLRLDDLWVGGLQAYFGQDLFRASWIKVRIDEEQWIEIGIQRHQFQDGFTVGCLQAQKVSDSLSAPEHTSWLSLPSASIINAIDIYEQRELVEIVAPSQDIPAESLNYDSLLVLKMTDGSAIMLGMEQNFIDGELVILQTLEPERQVAESLRLRRTLQ
ncbi:MAG: hypothetical protein V7731_10705 [Amphritea sp.]